MQHRLAKHAGSAANIRVKMDLALSGALHAGTRVLHRVWLDGPVRVGPIAKKRSNSMARQMLVRMDRAWPIRRQYMAPFSHLNFSTQVANASLMEDYLQFDP
jgi:hypothetical protein